MTADHNEGVPGSRSNELVEAPNADVPLCGVCEERPAEGTFWRDEPVCRACAEGAVDDGHMTPQDFAWWAPATGGRAPAGGDN